MIHDDWRWLFLDNVIHPTKWKECPWQHSHTLGTQRTQSGKTMNEYWFKISYCRGSMWLFAKVSPLRSRRFCVGQPQKIHSPNSSRLSTISKQLQHLLACQAHGPGKNNHRTDCTSCMLPLSVWSLKHLRGGRSVSDVVKTWFLCF